MLIHRRSLAAALIALLACCCLSPADTTAQEPTDLTATSLAIAPQDAAFFMTAIDLKKSWDRFIQGNFVKSLRRVDYVQQLEREIIRQWENPQGQAAELKSTLQNPNVRDLLRLAADMAGQEFFVYGQDDWCDAFENLAAFQSELMSRIQEDPESVEEYFNELDRQEVDGLRLPTTIIGFRLTDANLAAQQLDALEGILRAVATQDDNLRPFIEKLRRNDLADGQTLTLTLDTSLIPLDRLDEDQREAADKALELLEGRSFSISLGVRKNLLLIGMGEQADLLEQVGQAEDLLIDHPRMSVLKEANVSQLRSVSFVSQRWRQTQWDANFAHYFRNLMVQFGAAIDSESDEIDDAEEWKAELLADANQLDEYIGQMAPQYGDSLGWSHAITSGSEGWAYDWSDNMWFENNNPLQILEHAGSNSLFLMAFKQRSLPALEEMCDFLMQRIPEHAERFIASAEQDEEERETALELFQNSWPLVEEAVDILHTKISPALDENETLISMAAAWMTRELGSELPVADQPLPLPEFALACKLRDRELFLDGCQDLYGVFDKIVELVRETEPDALPAGYVVPRPIEDNIDDATTYYYEELAGTGSLSAFKPQLAIADDVVILGYSDRQVRDMIEPKVLATRPAWLTDETPVAVVSYVDYGGILGAFRPWMTFGISLAGMPLNEPLFPAEGPVPTGNDLLQIWDTFSAAGIAAATASVGDGEPTVMHWVWVSR